MTIFADDAFYRFINDLGNEIERARENYPGNLHRVASLSCEYGEVMVEYQKLLGSRPGASIENMKAELLQVAAMAYRIITEGDPTLPSA